MSYKRGNRFSAKDNKEILVKKLNDELARLERTLGQITAQVQIVSVQGGSAATTPSGLGYVVPAAPGGGLPSPHSITHKSGGGDSIKLDDLAAPDDNTDLDATVSVHGLLPKLGGGTTNFLRADGSWSAPPGAGADNVAINWLGV